MKVLFISIIISLSLFCTTTTTAQESTPLESNNSHVVKPQFIYCTITGYYSLKERMSIEMDFGQKRNRKKTLRYNTGELAEIYSMPGALNYLAKDGWEFVQAYTTIRVFNEMGNSYEHWILRKDISDMSEEEVEVFLHSYFDAKHQ